MLDTIIAFTKGHPVITVTIFIGAVYFLTKYLIFGGYPCGLELLVLFLFYEFTSLKYILNKFANNTLLFQIYIKMLADKHLGEVTLDDIKRDSE